MTQRKLTHRKRTDEERRVRQADAVARKLTLLRILSGRGLFDKESLARELAEQCGRDRYSTKTIERDLKVLRLVGFMIQEPDGGTQRKQYRISPRAQFPNLNLSKDELLGQAAATVVASQPQFGLSGAAKPTTQRLGRQAEEVEDLLSDADGVMKVLGFKLADHSRHAGMIRTIQWALIEGTQLSGEYHSPYRDEGVKLTLHPYRLCLAHQAWYLIARAVGEDRPKTYRVQRFRSIRKLSARAQVPPDFSLEAYFGNAWGVYRGSQTYDIELEFTRDAAAIVQETQWHPTQQVLKRNEDGGITLGFSVDGLDEIVWWVLGWTGRVKVVQPKELRKLVVEQLRAGLAMNKARGA
jgi:predicted DNA-binding transcriptional regulator YafY